MPERFALEYIGPDNEKHRPVMIHRAILGSIERFIGILIEHYAGDFPLWLAPVQCVVLPITEKHLERARNVLQALKIAGIRCHLDERNEKIGFKIRDAEMNRINYMGIIGDSEVESDSVSLRQRKKGNIGILSVKQLTEKLVDEIQQRRPSH
jgi:threonyl-tRNA synthetase